MATSQTSELSIHLHCTVLLVFFSSLNSQTTNKHKHFALKDSTPLFNVYIFNQRLYSCKEQHKTRMKNATTQPQRQLVTVWWNERYFLQNSMTNEIWTCLRKRSKKKSTTWKHPSSPVMMNFIMQAPAETKLCFVLWWTAPSFHPSHKTRWVNEMCSLISPAMLPNTKEGKQVSLLHDNNHPHYVKMCQHHLQIRI